MSPSPMQPTFTCSPSPLASPVRVRPHGSIRRLRGPPVGDALEAAQQQPGPRPGGRGDQGVPRGDPGGKRCSPAWRAFPAEVPEPDEVRAGPRDLPAGMSGGEKVWCDGRGEEMIGA
ncbi:hypothetical protein ACE1SV_52200 [Streptomyces sennicomposti]